MPAKSLSSEENILNPTIADNDDAAILTKLLENNIVEIVVS